MSDYLSMEENRDCNRASILSMEENRDWWRTYAKELLEESQMKNDDIKQQETVISQLKSLVDELRKGQAELRQDAKILKATSERWKQNCEDIGKAADEQETQAYNQECRIEQLHIDLEHAMSQNKALVAHTTMIDDLIMDERKRAHRENKAFQVEQAKEIENLELELERVTGNSLTVQVEKMQEMVDVLWEDRSFHLCCGKRV